MSTPDQRPSIDHGLLSPSGRMSGAARRRALNREAARLFPGGLAAPACPQPTPAEALRRQAAELLDLAGRGMSPRRYRLRAALLLAQASALEEA